MPFWARLHSGRDVNGLEGRAKQDLRNDERLKRFLGYGCDTLHVCKKGRLDEAEEVKIAIVQE